MKTLENFVLLSEIVKFSKSPSSTKYKQYQDRIVH
jgi:hypothetical protein